ncbi:MAG: hypothetical protein C0501_00080 [Isosphaera sp.]|nr:hypothetical protein [Isosphaera sp.]
MAVKPRLRLALLCSHVTFDGNGLPFALNEPIHTLRIPAGTVGGYRPPPLALYTQIEDAVGTFPFSVEVRDEREYVVNPSPPRVPVTFPGTEHRAVPLEQVFAVDVTFPGPGVYLVHLVCNHRSLHELVAADDRPFPAARVNVLG